MERSDGALTRFGFTWGPVEVVRACEVPGGFILDVKTEHAHLEVYVSKKGKRIRCFDRGGDVRWDGDRDHMVETS